MTTTEKHPLGLRPAEWKAICDCMWARKQVPNGHFLPAPNRMAAHSRMAARGFLTEVEHEFSPPVPEWHVFMITDENIAAYNAALAKVVKA
ncbi:MAG: hypothetical protein E5V96_13025 [Mesorhizobium sp.]|nr:MAG: hypothetical protein E5V96_13025 [Mesorhizobium sp.]